MVAVSLPSLYCRAQLWCHPVHSVSFSWFWLKELSYTVEPAYSIEFRFFPTGLIRNGFYCIIHWSQVHCPCSGHAGHACIELCSMCPVCVVCPYPLSSEWPALPDGNSEARNISEIWIFFHKSCGPEIFEVLNYVHSELLHGKFG